jgi:hypothetical protein
LAGHERRSALGLIALATGVIDKAVSMETLPFSVDLRNEGTEKSALAQPGYA